MFQLINGVSFARLLSEAGIYVSCGRHGFKVAKTIAMSAKYKEIPEARVILNENIRFTNITKDRLNSKLLKQNLKNSFLKSDEVRNIFINSIVDAAKPNVGYSSLPDSLRISKTHYYLVTSKDVTEELDKFLGRLYEVKLNEQSLCNEIIREAKDYVKTVANELHLDLTVEKNMMDGYYLQPYIASKKLEKASKGIYKTTEMIREELVEHLAKIEADKANQTPF